LEKNTVIPSLQRERYAPYMLALLSAIIWHVTDTKLPEDSSILSASLTLSAILTGFLATAKTIVMSSLESAVMIRVKKSGYLVDLISYLKQAIWLSFSFCIVSLIGFFIINSDYYYGLTWIIIGISSGAAFIRVTDILLTIISKG